jgi:WXG100 family type VII secretion target
MPDVNISTWTADWKGVAGSVASVMTIKVTPEELVSASENVLTKLTAAEAAFNEMGDIVKRTSSYWMGEAGDKHRKMFSDKEPDMEKILSRFREHAADLKVIASNYVSAEQAASSIAESLPADVIV